MKDTNKFCAVSRAFRGVIAVAGMVAITQGTAIQVRATQAVTNGPTSGAYTNLTACTCLSEVIVRASTLAIKPDKKKPSLDQRKPLLAALEVARRRIAVCNATSAGRWMVTFVNRAQALVKKGSLDQATVDSLTVCAMTINLCGSTCSVPVNDQPPVALAKSLVLSADSQCQADAPALQFDNGSYDPGGAIVSRSITPPGPYPLGETLVTYAVVDNRGSLSSVGTSVLVQDTTGPNVSNFATNFLVSVTPGQTGGTAVFPQPVVSDSCAGVAAVSFSPPSGAYFPLGVTPAALILIDGLGITNRIPFNVVVHSNSGGGGGGGGGGSGGNLPPVAIAHAVTNAADENCQAIVTAAQIDNHSFSPNSNGSIVSEFVTPSGPFPVGSVTPVTLTVVDNQGLSNSTVTTVTVVNRTPPVILTPVVNIPVTPAPGQQSVVVNYPTLTFTSTCSSASSLGVSYSPPSGTTFGVGTNPVTCRVFDGAGNTNITTFQVIVAAFDASACNTIPGLIQVVQAIPLKGNFNTNRKSNLVKALNQAQLDVTLGRTTAASYVMGGFINSVSIYKNLSVLDDATAGGLIVCATYIQSHL